MAYRGQGARWPLQTSFHRTKRNDLRRYVNEDIPTLHRALTGRINHIFNLTNPDENGAFFNLAQHHGFPTPLLDWTYSPYIAAYFAFSEATRTNSKEENVKIFLMDRKKLLAAQTKFYTNVVFTRPHISLLEPFSIENNRAVPQQGLQMLSNLHNIEGYIRHLESRAGTSIISSFDIPTHFAEEALNDLRLMGITRASLFPGIDGICHEMRIRQFES